MKTLFPILLLLCFASCDPGGCEKFTVHNASSSNIFVDMGSVQHIDTTYIIASGAEMDTYSMCGIGRGTRNIPEASTPVTNNKVYQIRKDSVLCKRDFTKYGSWLGHKNGKWDHSYTFTVTDADF